MRIIFICTANVCRSPLAEGYLKFLLSKISADSTINAPGSLDQVEVESAGVAALTGAAPFDCAQDVARHYRFDISRKRAQQLTVPIIQAADRILCMETWHASAVMRLDPTASRKVSLLGAYHPASRPLLQIPDPINFTTVEMFVSFEVIQKAVDGLMQTLTSKRAE
jgi:protein-tyrosine phosphatase